MLEFIQQLLTGFPLTTCFTGLGAGLFVYWLIQKFKYNYPPGPWAPPLIGHLWSIDQNNMLYEVAKWSEKYGPVVTVRLGPKAVVVVNKIEPAIEVLLTKTTDFADRLRIATFDVFTRGGKDIAFSNYGPTWKLHKRISTQAFRHYMQGPALEHRIHAALEAAFEEIDKHVGGRPFDNTEYINFIVGNILTGLCFGATFKFGDKEVNYVLERKIALVEFGSRMIEDIVPFFSRVYKSKGYRRLEKFVDEIMDDFFGKRFDEAKETFNRNNMRHLIDNLILARLEAEEEEGAHALKSLTDEHIIQTISDVFFAGIDTSRYTLRYAILHMIALPDIQEKVQAEIDSVVGKCRLPGMDDRPNLAYTEAVLHESMRLASVAPSGLTHATCCDTEVCGYRIPKGTAVIINHWALHHDPEGWEDVEKFKPERYLDENGKLGPKAKNWLPFSAGNRMCMGEFVAKPQLHLLFASLMQRYKWRAEPGTKVDLEAESTVLARTPKPYKCMIDTRV